jgi:hypothetical protein
LAQIHEWTISMNYRYALLTPEEVLSIAKFTLENGNRNVILITRENGIKPSVYIADQYKFYNTTRAENKDNNEIRKVPSCSKDITDWDSA